MQRYFKNNKINIDFEDTQELNGMLAKLEKQDKNKYLVSYFIYILINILI